MVDFSGSNSVFLQQVQGDKILVIGCTELALVQARNLRDSGLQVKFSLDSDSDYYQRVADLGFDFLPLAAGLAWGETIYFTAQDCEQVKYYQQIVEHLPANTNVIFSEVLSTYFNLIKLPEDLAYAAILPTVNPELLLQEYRDGKGAPSVVALNDKLANSSTFIGIALAICGIQAEIVTTTIEEAANTEIFLEKNLVDKGILKAVADSWNTLEKKNYPPNLSYLFMLRQLKQVTEEIIDKGFAQVLDRKRKIFSEINQVMNDNNSGESYLKVIGTDSFKKKISENFKTANTTNSSHKTSLNDIEPEIREDISWL